MKDTHWNLIAKYLAGETTPEEEKQVRELQSRDREFARELKESGKLWDKISWQNSGFDSQKGKQQTDKKIRRSGNRWLRIAATVAIVLGLAWTGWRASFREVVLTAHQAKQEFILPDGSRIFLKKGTTISYTQWFFSDFNRQVKLSRGEAYFEITKKHGKAFSVNTGSCKVHVLGTKFDVTKTENSMEVVLTEGKVLLDDFPQTKETVLMQPGDRVIWNGQRVEKERVNARIYALWTKDRIEFHHFSMTDMETVFQKYFGKTLVIRNGKVLQKHIAGSAPMDDYKLIIKGLSEVLKTPVIAQGDSIIIK